MFNAFTLLRRLHLFACASLCWPMTLSAQQDADAVGVTFFEEKIRPVLVKHCYSCHSAEAKIVRGGLRLDTRQALLRGGDSGPGIVPRKPAASQLLAALRYDGLEMPPGGKLSTAIIADFERWIRMGAPDPRDAVLAPRSQKRIDYREAMKFWAFVPPADVSPPVVREPHDVQNPIDRFVLARLQATGLKPVGSADRGTLIRRVTFGLTGLPPSPAEVGAFLEDDQPGAFTRVIDRLLGSRHYGERWARHWLDVARYGEDQAHTFKARRYPHGHRYRDWVVAALNADMPYDRFVQNQIAGDLIGDSSNRFARLAALGFFAMGPVYYQDNGEKAKALADEWDDRVDTLSRGLLGLTLSCARCHDHKYDPITMEDYYGLAGIFASTQYQERPVVAPQVVRARRQADDRVKQHQLEMDRFLDGQARDLRPSLVDRIPEYVVAAWTLHNRRQAAPNDKKLSEKVAQQLQLSAELIKRWEAYLYDREKAASRPYLSNWFAWLATQSENRDQSGDASLREAVRQQGETLHRAASAALPRRQELFRRFGENVAFVNAKDRAVVAPGYVPLGNLFDDKAGTSLDAALASDRFKAIATSASLGVDRVAAGWGNVAQIAAGVRFHFIHLGSDDRSHGAIANDAWGKQGGIRTLGQRASANLGRTEQGIGMHANALVTFDLDEIRRAGLLPADQKFVFKVDRAGINDDVFGSDASAHISIILSKPHSKPEVYDAILAGYVNGRRQKVEENDKEYYFAGPLPQPLRADGKYAEFTIPVPPAARYLTLVTTGAGAPTANSINCDHSVLSGARLELDPLPEATLAAREERRDADQNPSSRDQPERLTALLLSELLFDQGLLAVPASEAAELLPEPVAGQWKARQTHQEKLKQRAASIQILLAHALQDSGGADLQIYRSGDPATPGETAPRSFPAILTDGKRRPFQSSGSGRLELARAITAPGNPLTARVIVNRVWAGHFGFGLVRTPSNFGSLGERPTHPQLLDWLAVRFVEHGWSLKWLHRTILHSATYQRAADFSQQNDAVDADNRLLWRMNRRRLEVEPWRDAMLAVSGNLDRAQGGPSQNLNDAANRRRTLYGFVSRHKLNELLRLFDFPDPNITSDRRTSTTVPLQQLFVLNSDFMTRQARSLALHLMRDVPIGGTTRIRRAYELLFARLPSAAEVAVGVEFLEQASRASAAGSNLSNWEQYALGLLASNEFTYLD
ncbi:MAG: hypothetical protein CMJ75_10715 [Planctomycetaceae bacterium]|nr:hypothetical protein [Planctomycetaceae bacterium]